MNAHIVRCREASIALFSIYESLKVTSGRDIDGTLDDFLSQLTKLKDAIKDLEDQVCSCHRDITDKFIPCKIHNGANLKMLLSGYYQGARDQLKLFRQLVEKNESEIDKQEKENNS